MASPKTKPTKVNVKQFMQSVEHAQRQKDGYTILSMMEKISGLKPKMWGPSIIGFGSYHYKYDSGHEGDAPLIAFSPRKQKQVLYVLSGFKNQDKLLAQLGKYKTGKVCLYINKLADVDLAVLEKIIQAAWLHINEQEDGKARC